MSDTLYIVMPAYNEGAAIEDTIRQWYPVVEKAGAGSRLVIVNDGSTDNTYEVMMKLQANYPQLVPLHKSNTGHGPTCLYAYQYAMSTNADYIFQTDSDGQTKATEFWTFWEKRKEADFIIGNRRTRKDGLSRVVVAKVLKWILLLFFGTSVKDANTPFRLMKAERLKPMLDLIPSDFFLSNVMISVMVIKRKERHLWLPVSFTARQQGHNSINMGKIIRIGIKAFGDFYRMRKKVNS
jgi:glycosyltransferase involved in cell wall biosynthesis